MVQREEDRTRAAFTPGPPRQAGPGVLVGEALGEAGGRGGGYLE